MSDDHLLQVWARTPNQLAPADVALVAPLRFDSLSAGQELSREDTLDVGVNLDRIPDDARAYLRDPYTNPAELTLDRRGVDGVWRRVFTGPLWTVGVQGSTVSLHARGLLAYLRFMRVDNDTGPLVFAGVDQHQIVKALVDAWQALDYGHYALDTSAIVDGGQLRTVTYDPVEQHEVYQRVLELGARRGGFDVHVDAETRQLLLWTPQRGALRPVFFDFRNIASNSEQRSAGAGRVATSVHGVSSDGVADSVVTRTTVDAAGMAVFGRASHGISERGVSEQATLDDRVASSLTARTKAWYEPGPDLRLAVDADWDDFDVGDTVSLVYDAGLGEVSLSPRVVARTLQVAESGAERLTVEVD